MVSIKYQFPLWSFSLSLTQEWMLTFSLGVKSSLVKIFFLSLENSSSGKEHLLEKKPYMVFWKFCLLPSYYTSII